MFKYREFHIDFEKNKKYYFAFSLTLILIGLIFNVIFGTNLDIKFTGGSIIKYSYVGETVNSEQVQNIVKETTGMEAKVTLSSNIVSAGGDTSTNIASIEFSGNEAISIDKQNSLKDSLSKVYPDANFQLSESSSIDPTNGRTFFLKCLCAVAMASVLMLIYIGIRFRKIGGWSAGTMAVIGLLHDVLVIYFTFVIFKMPIDDNFIAVALTIIGYSLNDTIIIYDRIRENKRLLGEKTRIEKLVNLSINQTFTRTINTTVTTTLAISSVLAVAIIFNVSSVVTFAFPMLIGVVCGCYSTICISGPLWILWKNHVAKKNGTFVPIQDEENAADFTAEESVQNISPEEEKIKLNNINIVHARGKKKLSKSKRQENKN